MSSTWRSLVVIVVVAGMLGGAARGAGRPIRLVKTPALSPDGSQLALSYRGDIWIASSSGGPARRVTFHPDEDRDPHFSPDGRRIAFISRRAGGSQVFVMPAEGGQPRQITFHSEGYGIEDWAPDGRSLLVSGSRDHDWRHAERFFEVSLEERSAERLLFDAYGSDASISPDGGRVLFVREGGPWWRKGYRGARSAQIWLWERKSGKFAKLLDEPTDCRWPLWAPDGKGFYYVSGRGGAFNLWRCDFRRKKKLKQQPITHYDDDSVVFPAISRDGSTIVFRRLFDLYRLRPGVDEQPRKIELVDPGDITDEPVERVTVDRARRASFTDDGLEIAMIAGGDLWVMDTELREPRQVTDTPEEESSPVFSPDGQTLLLVADRDGQSDIWKAERADKKTFWWLNDRFPLTRLTNDAEVESRLQWSPDGKHVFFVKGRGDLWVMGADGRDSRRLVAGFDRPEYDISPDGKWIVYAKYDNDFNRDIWVAPVDGSAEPMNLSRRPNNDSSPVWSPDGRLIAFTGRRLGGDEVDIYYVWLRAADEDRTSRDRRLERAVEKIEKARKKKGSKPEEEDAERSSGAEKEGEPREKKADGEPPEVIIDFERISERLHRISIPDSTESGLFWSPDSKKLAFRATVDGKRGLYTVEFPEKLTPRLLSTTTGVSARWLKKPNQIVWLVDGTPGALSPSGEKSVYSFRAYQQVRPEEKRRAAFDLCWRTMRDGWYDSRLGNRNWDAVRRKYRGAAGEADWDSFATIIDLMLGELNGSHLGFSLRRRRPEEQDRWRETTAHLGIRFDNAYAGPGLRVRDVLPDGPADQAGHRVRQGEIIVSIDGVVVDPGMDLTQVLNGRLDRDIRLQVRAAPEGSKSSLLSSDAKAAADGPASTSPGDDAGLRHLTLRPISYSQARNLLYDKWVLDNRAAVDRLSNKTLGYLHVRAMNEPSFLEFQRELYSVGYGKDGLVIDVRENGGGFTTDHLLTSLTQPVHAITVARGGGPGYPQDRKVYATWNKPIVVLCNQNSFSNAEIFSHAIQTLHRGKLVGAPTAGGVISTGSVSIMDVGVLRLPFRGWFLLDTGWDMELNGAVPDVVVWPRPGELPRGKDVQLERAVQVLLDDVKKWKARPQPKLRKASELRGERAAK